jgi:hypothetical protein
LTARRGTAFRLWRIGYLPIYVSNDTIEEYDWNNGTSIDVVKFGEDVTGADLDLSRAGNSLKITIRNTADSLTIRNWFTSSGEKFPIDQFIFGDGTTVTGYELTQNYVSTLTGTPQDDILQGTHFCRPH